MAVSNLAMRSASAVVMIALAGGALWLGGYWFAALIALVAIGTFVEWQRLVTGFVRDPVARFGWAVAGLVYIGAAAAVLVTMRAVPGFVGILACGAIIALTVIIDVSAYAVGRMIGGPRIAPSISPAKTWAGLGGAIVGAAAAMVAGVLLWPSEDPVALPWIAIVVPALAGAVLAVLAQAGDFFESWMKRRAGVKDSGSLIPGHGGLFDRVDGLIPVAIVSGIGLLALLGWTRL